MPDAPAASPAPASAAPAQQAATAPTTGASPAAAAPATTTTTATPTQTAPATAPAAGGEAKPTEGTKPAADAKPTDKPAEAKTDQPKPFELKLPKDATIDTAIATELAAVAQKAGVSQEQAQAIAEFMDGKAKAFAESIAKAQDEAHQVQVKTWDEALKADKEIGGTQLQANLEAGRRVLERFGDAEVVEFLRETGLNCNPGIARLMVRIGKAMAEDRIATGNGAGGKSEEQILADRYPSMRKSA